MTDTNQSQSSTNVSSSINQENGAKKSFFGGGQNVFENLEKFEQISNPTPESQDFEFDFSDVTPEVSEISEEKTNFNLENEETPLDIPAKDQEFTSLENIGLDNIFQPNEEIQEGHSTFQTIPSEMDTEVERDPNEIKQGESQGELPDIEAEGEMKQEVKPEDSEIAVDDLDFKKNENKATTNNSESENSSFVGEETEEHQDSFSEISRTLEEDQDESTPSEPEQEQEQEGQTLTKEQQDYLKIEAEPQSDFSPLIQQFNTLLEQSKTILELENKIQKSDSKNFEIIGNNTEKSMISYQVSQDVENDLPKLILQRKEKNFARDEENEHSLSLTSLEKDKNLIVAINDYQLYEEEQDLQDPVKQLQVSDKLKKFSFLFSQRLSELEEQRETIKEEREKMKAFRAIFRNF